jgi:membrane-associated phospholipid phosphatase
MPGDPAAAFPPAFHLDWVQFLVEHRTPFATAFFQLFSFLGEIEGYVLVVAFLYVAVDKRLAFRLSVLVLATMCANHWLKTAIGNPRPFVREGTTRRNWAVSTARARELATEYSTPSGHAMAGSAFYAYLAAKLRSRAARVAAIAAILLTGFSRPVLGVHYVEDVVAGWAVGLAIALAALRFGDRAAAALKRLSPLALFAIVVGASALLWLATRSLYAARAQGPPLAFLSYTGFLAGIALAYPLESRWVGFDPTSSRRATKLLRYALSVSLVLGTSLLLDAAFARVAPDASALGNVLRFLRYAATSVAGFLLAPFLFVKLGLAVTLPGRR